ncbi:arginine/serine-rich coiled-coil protein 2 isoform X2 [Drosophila santomea]|nr:arginine/serine-rich coiled-coil protein 2 isoform X2 [Drosophila santomea]
MSQSDNVAREQTAASAVPEACQGCRGQLPRATPVEVEDMATPSLERLIRKANMAQKMLNDVMKQIQQESQLSTKESSSKHHSSDGGKRRHRGRKHGHHTSSSSSSSSGHSDCELILAEQEEHMPRSRRHIRDDRKRDRSRSRGRSRGHSRGRSHGRSRSRSYTDSRRSRALPLALPVRISV